MKKLMTALAAVLLLSLAAGFVLGPACNLLSSGAVKALMITIPKEPLLIVTPTPSPAFVPDPGSGIIVTRNPEFSLIPRVTPTPAITPHVSLPPPVQATPKPTDKPDKTKGTGQSMTSEGPLFLSFRKELTEELWMFTPMDLSLDSEYRFPLIGNASQVVGEAKVVVRSGMVIVSYLVVSGVQVDTKNEFFTFFPDIRSVSSVKPSKLQHVKLEFGLPYSVASWLGSDPNVLLYINCPVSYKTNLAGLMPFSFQDPGYLERMMNLLPLMD